MIKNNLILLITFLLVLTSCQSVKDGLSGAKSDNNDEFLVQKKNPLVLPPKYLELPKPKNSEEEELLYEEDFDIEKILGLENRSVPSKTETNKSAEDFVLKNIKNN
tara:strand:- start:986 stop:1303 length:318 start_codon:yes stop_codon:yes gene_type:complete